jgi:hypothetical protein
MGNVIQWYLRIETSPDFISITVNDRYIFQAHRSVFRRQDVQEQFVKIMSNLVAHSCAAADSSIYGMNFVLPDPVRFESEAREREIEEEKKQQLGNTSPAE